jgi:hypothetical protein
MTSYPRLILPLAATIGFVAMLSASAPAIAAESVIPAASGTSSIVKHHAPRSRLAASSYHRRFGSIRSDLGCSGVWCGRQFVLMVGIAY